MRATTFAHCFFRHRGAVCPLSLLPTASGGPFRSFSAAKKKKKVSAGAGSSDALANAIAIIEAAHGKGSLMQLGSSPITSLSAQDIIPTGSIALDIALGVGGFPRGRVVEIYGPESSGKTTVALHAIAEAQKQGGTCAFIDAEHAIDAQYAKKLGVNIDQLYISQPDHGEQALEITDTLVSSGAIDVIVIDSVSALVPKLELEGEMGASHVALQARLMSQALRKLTGSLARSNTLLIFINQIRQKVGVMFGSNEVTSGGNALRFFASVRLDIRRRTQIKEGDKVIGNEIVIKVAKNKLAPPFRLAHFDMIFNVGIDRFSELLTLGTDAQFIVRSGAWYSYMPPSQQPLPLGQGKQKAKIFLMEHEEVAMELETRIRAHARALMNGEKEEDDDNEEEEKVLHSDDHDLEASTPSSDSPTVKGSD